MTEDMPQMSDEHAATPIALKDGVYLLDIRNGEVTGVDVPIEVLASSTLNEASGRYLLPALAALRDQLRRKLSSMAKQ